MYIIAITHICLPNYEHICFCWWPSAMTFSDTLMTNRRHLLEMHQPSATANIWSAQSFHEKKLPVSSMFDLKPLSLFLFIYLFRVFALHYKRRVKSEIWTWSCVKVWMIIVIMSASCFIKVTLRVTGHEIYHCFLRMRHHYDRPTDLSL